MNQTRAKLNRQGPAPSGLNTAIVLALALSFGTAFWAASLPIAHAAVITPAEMIQKNLPHSMTLASAPQATVLAAVRKTIAQNPKDSPDIVRTAAGVRKELTADILKMAVTSLQDARGVPDCELARSALQQAIAVDAEQAASLTELFVRLTPTCLDSPSEGPNPAFGNINAAPGSVPGGASAVSDTCSVCHNNQTIQVPCPGMNQYLSGHPGDTAGACEASAVTNR